jgi:hypothetical protein
VEGRNDPSHGRQIRLVVVQEQARFEAVVSVLAVARDLVVVAASDAIHTPQTARDHAVRGGWNPFLGLT